MRILYLLRYHYGWFKIVGKVKCVIELKLQLIVIVQRYETFSLLFQLDYTWSIKYGTWLFSPFLAVRTSTPLSVTTIVCSNWADNFPSCVTEVQLSGHVWSVQTPWEIIGSIVKAWPGFITPTAGKDIEIIYFEIWNSPFKAPSTFHINLHNIEFTFIFGIVRNIWSTMEELMNSMTTITSDYGISSWRSMLLNFISYVPIFDARFNHCNCFV